MVDVRMTAHMYPIPGPWSGRLLIVPRPRGADWLAGEVAAWRCAGIDLVVSLLMPDENADLGITGEEAECRASGVDFLAFPIPDRGVPASRTAALDLLRRVEAALTEGKTVAVHCRQGIGRSAIVATGLLILSGFDPDVAIRRVQDARGLPVPETAEQREWIGGLSRPLVPPLSAAQRQELDRRLADLDAHPDDESDWEDAIARLRRRP
jgi:Polymorphic toxin system, DSP-PTPase phosphatase/Putative addiction module component